MTLMKEKSQFHQADYMEMMEDIKESKSKHAGAQNTKCKWRSCDRCSTPLSANQWMRVDGVSVWTG